MLQQADRERLALTLVTKRFQRYGGYSDVREQNRVAGQIRDPNDTKLFAGKEGKGRFAAFLERAKTNTVVTGDGAVALALIIHHYREKMRSYRNGEQYPERFVPELTREGAVQLVTDEDLDDLGLTASEIMELGQLVDWLKATTFPKVART